MISNRIEATENPYIEDIVDRYADIPNITNLALGSSYWDPPAHCLEELKLEILARDTQRYGNILGYPPLIQKLEELLGKQGLDLSDEAIAITAGANQGFMNVALTLTDSTTDEVIILAPYYFSHLLSLQLCQVKKIHVCPFNSQTLYPDWGELELMIQTHQPKMIVVTNPNNPSGLVWHIDEIHRLSELCRRLSPKTWLVFDQTYYEFQYSASSAASSLHHIFPNRNMIGYDKVIHLFSMSKVFAMPGWRVGFLVFPKELTNSMRKIQDTIPTHATILSQKLALKCLQTYSLDTSETKNEWFNEQLKGLETVREALWPMLEKLGTVKTFGAFYFLVPLPPNVKEEEVVDLFARKYGILLMPGTPFGAKNHLRLSYGGIPPNTIMGAIERLQSGFEEVDLLSKSRT